MIILEKSYIPLHSVSFASMIKPFGQEQLEPTVLIALIKQRKEQFLSSQGLSTAIKVKRHCQYTH